MKNKLFVGGDLSGIQNFIYNISSKKAAVSLRGRSYYISEYMKQAYERLTNSIGNCTEIYNDGGKFYFICDDTVENKEKISLSSKEENSLLWREHFGLLSLNLAYYPFSQDDEKGNREQIALCFQNITKEFNKKKKQKFKELLLENYDSMFEPQQVDEQYGVCDITGIESRDLVSIEGELKVLPSVKEQITKGEELRKEEKFKAFSDYAKGSYFGVLRMDVDGLGTCFASGFDTWQEYKTFSNGLTDFFKNKIKTMFDKEKVGLMYAGGDDIFAVGHWSELIDFAEKVHKELDKDFAQKNLHISGGIVIGNDKFPISKYAILSGYAEEKSKKHIYKEKEKNAKGKEKNAFTFFDETVSWEEEFDRVKQYKDRLLHLVETENLSRGLLQQIMLYYEGIKRNPKDFSFLWHTAYYLTRYIKNQPIKDFCTELRDKVLINRENYRILAISSRWAELLLRDKENNKNK
ncbi:MAG: hypothetical protein IJ180_04230 [Bacteroidales bacterium]|nr:hypothetical protein [Bacteroidales bacterium]